ncbi:MAG: NUDIX hydrolase [Lacipirellulaceae bacterium]
MIEELKEEIGAHVTEISKLGSYYPDSGLMSSIVHVYIAMVEVGRTVDKNEAISEIRHVGWGELSTRIANGEIDDGFTLSSLALLRSTEQSDGTMR